MLNRDVADQFHHVDGLANTRTPEQPNLATLGKWADQIDHLDPGFQQFIGRSLLFVTGSLPMDSPTGFLTNGSFFINRFAEHVHDATQRFLADWHRNRCACIADGQTATQTIGAPHGNRPDDAVSKLLLDFQYQRFALHLQGVIDLGKRFAGEFDVDNSANDLNDFSRTHVVLFD